MKRQISCYVSKYGLPTLAESGGKKDDSGYAVIIANKEGKKKSPIYIFNKGNNIINGEHALFVIKENDLRIEVTNFLNKFQIDIYKVESIDIKNKKVDLLLIESYSNNDYLSSNYYRAISVAINKSITVSCKEPFYIYTDKNRFQKKLVTNY